MRRTYHREEVLEAEEGAHVPEGERRLPGEEEEEEEQDHLKMNNSTRSNNHLRGACKNVLGDFFC